MLCPKLISYFISKRNIKERFLKLFTQVSWQKTTSISRPGSSWKTWYWYCLSNFLQTTGFQIQVIKKKHFLKFSTYVSWKKTIRPKSSGKSPEVAHLMLPKKYFFLLSKLKSKRYHISWGFPIKFSCKKQAYLEAAAISEWKKWPQLQFSISQFKRIIPPKSFLGIFSSVKSEHDIFEPKFSK